jgi:hypothetical protein
MGRALYGQQPEGTGWTGLGDNLEWFDPFDDMPERSQGEIIERAKRDLAEGAGSRLDRTDYPARRGPEHPDVSALRARLKAQGYE